jgi:putative spermidine/putrescine transport system permease protein
MRFASVALVGAVLAFLFLPLIVVAGASLGGGDQPYVSFPPTELSLQWYMKVPAQYWQALLVSVLVATGASLVSVVIAVPIALGLVRARFFGKTLISHLLRAPLQIPFVVTGIAFLQLYYLLSAVAGYNLRASFAGLIVGHVFLTSPYVIGSIVSVLMRFNTRLEEAATSLGANPWRVFCRVTLPVIMPGVFGGALYAFIISFGEVPVALFLGGPGRNTFPVELFSSMQFDFSPSLLAVSTAVLVASFALLILIQRLVGLDVMVRSSSTR